MLAVSNTVFMVELMGWELDPSWVSGGGAL